ncbi:hypothetical protein NUSPORA_00914 [Nucleospora cyclopteri]
MGIKQLAKLIKSNCPSAVKTREFKFFSGSKIAIDASMCIYQFLIAVRSDGQNMSWGDSTTSHLIGLFYRTIRIIEAGITPVYVFDGKAPASKVHELAKRSKRRREADAKLKEAQEKEDKELIEKYSRMKVKIEQTHIDDCQQLLKLLRIPYVTAPSEAEAFCAYLNKEKLVDGVATEDMDTLCFGTPILLRNFNASQAKKLFIEEYSLSTILKELQLKMNEFIDLCILLGSDFCGTLKGIGPKRALALINEHRTIDIILKENPNMEILGENFDYEKAREIFNTLSNKEINQELSLEAISNISKLKVDFNEIAVEPVVEYLVDEKGFDKIRVTNGVNKILAMKNKGKQMKLEQFFKKTNK